MFLIKAPSSQMTVPWVKLTENQPGQGGRTCTMAHMWMSEKELGYQSSAFILFEAGLLFSVVHFSLAGP